MSEYLIQGETLTNIADAIRGKTGETGFINPAQFATKIADISTSGGSGGNLDSELLKYFVYQLDDEKKELVIFGILYTKLYEETGSYDITIPNTIGSYQVVIASEGVI